MKKRVLSILVTLTMIASMLGSFVIVANAEGIGNLEIAYYACNSDGSIGDKITQVDEEDQFYVKVELSNFLDTGAHPDPGQTGTYGQLSFLYLCIGYDKNYITPVNFTTGADLDLSGLGKDSYGAYVITDLNAAGVGEGGIFDVSRSDPVLKDKKQNAQKTHFDDFMNGTSYPVIDTENAFYALGANESKNSYLCINKDDMYIFRFKANSATDQAETLVYLASVQNRDEDKCYIPDPQVKASGYSIYQRDNSDDLNITEGKLDIATKGAPKLPKVENVKIEGGKVKWDAVAGAAKYKIALSVTNGSGSQVDYYEVDGNKTEWTIPNTVIGSVNVRVQAISGSPANSDGNPSDELPAPVLIKGKIAKPTNLAWSGDTLSWTASANATGYEVTVYKDSTAVGSPLNVTDLQCDLSAVLEEPEIGAANYTVKVVAKGDQYYDDSDAAETARTIKGKLAAPTNVQWQDVSDNANWNVSWTASPNAAYYIIYLNSAEGEKTINNITGTSANLSEHTQTPGKYTFKVVAAGGDTGYKSSVPSGVSTEKTKMGKLSSVTDLVWDGWIVKWNHDGKNTLKYEVVLTNLDTGLTQNAGSVPSTDKKEYDFSNIINGAGNYRVTVTPIGENAELYKNGDPVSAEKEFAQAVDAPTNPDWNGNNATWTIPADITQITGYEIVLYYGDPDGKYYYEYPTHIKVTGDANTNSFDLSGYFDYEGDYYFKVLSVVDSSSAYSSSKLSDKSPKKVVTKSNKKGSVTFKLYADPELTTPVATTTAVGQDVYLAIIVNDIEVSSMQLPVKYDPTMFMLVDYYDGESDKSDWGVEWFNLSGLLDENGTPIYKLDIVNDADYPNVDDENGLIKLAYTTYSKDNSTFPAMTDVCITVLRFTVIGSTGADGTDITFANAAKDSVFDASSYGGLLMVKTNATATEKVYATEVPVEDITLNKAKLKTPEKPVWSDSTITWKKVAGAGNYEVKLYKNGVFAETITVLGGDTESYNMEAKLTDYSATYTASVIAKSADPGKAYDSDESAQSDAYVRPQQTSGGRSSGTLAKPKKPVWNGTNITWNGVSNAEKYELKVYENGNLIATIPVGGSDNKSVDLGEYLKDKGSEYKVSVTAISDKLSSRTVSDLSDA